VRCRDRGQGGRVADASLPGALGEPALPEAIFCHQRMNHDY
jgi:hypothetical protein